jgi:hypothetical protein
MYWILMKIASETIYHMQKMYDGDLIAQEILME